MEQDSIKKEVSKPGFLEHYFLTFEGQEALSKIPAE